MNLQQIQQSARERFGKYFEAVFTTCCLDCPDREFHKKQISDFLFQEIDCAVRAMAGEVKISDEVAEKMSGWIWQLSPHNRHKAKEGLQIGISAEVDKKISKFLE